MMFREVGSRKIGWQRGTWSDYAARSWTVWNLWFRLVTCISSRARRIPRFCEIYREEVATFAMKYLISRLNDFPLTSCQTLIGHTYTHTHITVKFLYVRVRWNFPSLPAFSPKANQVINISNVQVSEKQKKEKDVCSRDSNIWDWWKYLNTC